MGSCIICGTSTDGPICDVHQEDVLFEFEGDRPEQLTPGRFYRGTVDGYAEFGVFVDIGNVTGLLHRSKLDRRLESLEWDVGDRVAVQVNNIRDNGDIDLGWSIRQTPEEFRGLLVDAPDGDYLADEHGDDGSETESGSGSNAGSDAGSGSGMESGSGSRRQPATGTPSEAEEDDPSFDFFDEDTDESATDAAAESGASSADDWQRDGGDEGQRDAADGPQRGGGDQQRGGDDGTDGSSSSSDAEPTGTATGDDDDGADFDRVTVEELRDRVGDLVRLEGEVVSVRQTSGPTVFELRDETGVVDCAAFVEAGVRAYPDVEADDVVRLDGEVRLRRDEIQVETESLVALEDDAREAVVTRMDEALDDRASPDGFELLADEDGLEAVDDDVTAAATKIRRAVLESRPVVVRHDATTDGYVAGAAVERAVLPLVEEEHASADAVYHYFDRRPLEDGVYDMNDATKDATRMLGDRERHDEKLPLFVFAAAGSTAASTDGLELLDVYGAPRVVLDGRPADEAVVDEIDSLVTAEERTASTVAANVAAAVNEEVREDLTHLPAVSYWDDAPESYVDLTEEAGVDAETARQLREAVALEAFYQSYEDKRELIVDLLFEKRTGLAEQVSGQFRTKLEAEVDTATANIDERTVEGATVAVLDTDAYTHQYDFPPTRLLLDELHRRLDADAVVGVATDELHVRTDAVLDVEAVVAALQSAAPNAGVSDPGARQPKLEFLRGEREAVIEAVVDAVAEQIVAPSA
jgi:RecJ-like exonuclease